MYQVKEPTSVLSSVWYGSDFTNDDSSRCSTKGLVTFHPFKHCTMKPKWWKHINVLGVRQMDAWVRFEVYTSTVPKTTPFVILSNVRIFDARILVLFVFQPPFTVNVL